MILSAVLRGVLFLILIKDVDLKQLTYFLQLVNLCSNNKCRAPFTQVCLVFIITIIIGDCHKLL